MFDYCPALKEVKFSSRIRELPARMFTECPALTRLELPEGVTKIGQAALQGAVNLEHLYIPSSVTEIADDAMAGLTRLTVHGKKIHMLNTIAAYTGFLLKEKEAQSRRSLIFCLPKGNL